MWDTLLKNINEETLNSSVELWGGEPDSILLISLGINAVYRFKFKAKYFYLRLTHEKLRPINELESAIAFQDYLFKSKVPICQPVLSIRNNVIEEIQQGDDVFLAHVCHEVPGGHMNFDFESQQLYEDWGRVLAELHQASMKYDPENHQYGQWENDIDELQGYVKTEPQEMREILLDLLDKFKKFPKNNCNYGLIHGDHRKGNVLTDGQQIHLIDFDLPRLCWFMDDISRPFFSSIMLGHMNWQSKLLPYIKGYRSIKQLKQADLYAFPDFLHYKAMNMYLWTKYNWEGDTAPGGMNTKDWLESLLKMVVNDNWKIELKSIMKTL